MGKETAKSAAANLKKTCGEERNKVCVYFERSAKAA
jgi:hypothetical protein